MLLPGSKKAALTCFFLFFIHLESVNSAQIAYLDVLIFGDSITQGLARTAAGSVYGVTSPPRGARISWWGYGIHLETLIENDLGRDTSSVYNWGYGGLRSDQALRCDGDWDCLDAVLSSREANMIMIMLGANDLYAGISSTTTRFNLSVMLDKSLAMGIEPVIGTITPNTSLDRGKYIDSKYNLLIRELAQEKGVLLADHYPAMSANWTESYTSGDGLHLNDDGNRKLAETWYDALKASKIFTSPGFLPALNLLLNK